MEGGSSSNQNSTLTGKKGIAELYDEFTVIWEEMWGEHMHHGFYDLSDDRLALSRTIDEALRSASVPSEEEDPSKSKTPKRTVDVVWEVFCGDHMDHNDSSPVSFSISHDRLAQVRMMDEALRFASIPSVEEDPFKSKTPNRIVDVGCGTGGESVYLARKYGAKCWGFTLSPFQVEKANALAILRGLSDQVSFLVGDALSQPFPDGQFDLVWSMESAEHMPDKKKFLNELLRVAAPGGTIIITTWCHRDLKADEDSLQSWEKEILDKFHKDYHLPLCSRADYVKLLQSLPVEDVKTADWTQHITPFWTGVRRSAWTWRGLMTQLRRGVETVEASLALPLEIKAHCQKGVFKYSVITFRKPK
ncbi:hypothetical protein CDL15_Pgr013067 [Punica granatum]|uniref:Methyltransferase type 11 domain-containing protein n=1 Tax=Punica granatum TaxID=22663 RepID=A0A218WJG6_PUNGR|nr:hypothetical protein CDL15_Pgr013067 [Punica granatum]